jgi:hypothetical protein
MSRKRIEVPALSAEFGDADLGDVRLNRRLGLLAGRLASLGGHLKSNGDPGWLVLGRGYTTSFCSSSAGEPGRRPRSDQS